MKHKIKGDIVSWNTSVWDFQYMMKNIKDNEDITLQINSYGGDVFLGIDICNTLRAHKGHVTIEITGIAASAASIICMGADTIKTYSNAQMMVHNAWTIAMGNADDFRKLADDLDSINESVLASYTHRVDEDVMKKLLDDETYLTAKKAKELGLVDEIIDVAEVEEVESELFANKAKEFNNSVSKMTDNIQMKEDDVITKADFEAFKNEITTLLNQSKSNQSKEEPTPTPQVAASKRRVLF